MDAAPVIARGHNLAVLTPPVAAAARPYLLALPPHRSALVLTADADRAVALHTALERADAVAVTGIARAARRLAAGRPGILLVSAADALQLLQRSALKAAEYETVVLAWPDQLDEEGQNALQTVMAEVARDSQRLILASAAGRDVAALIDRYAFKAVTFGFPPAEQAETPAPATPALGPAAYVVARARDLALVRRRVLDALDPEQDEDVVVAACPASREEAETLARAPAAAPAAPAAPEPARPRRLVFAVEPAELAWLGSLFAPLTPLRLPTALDALEQRAARVRDRLARTLEAGHLDRELFLLGPLLDRFDPAEVAAAALRLAAAGGVAEAAGAPERVAPAAEARAEGVAAWTRLWIGVGRKDGARPGDVLGAIIGEAKLAADHVGRIDLRELFALVDIRAEDAERVARTLTGTIVRGRRLTARVDRGGPPGAAGVSHARPGGGRSGGREG